MIASLNGTVPYAGRVKPPVHVVRAGYRLAYCGLRVYWFLVRPSVRGVKCILTRRDRVLLVRHSYGARTWELPGGTVKASEPPIATARREMAEELSVEIADWKLLGEFRGRMQYRHDRVCLFQAEVGDAPLVLELGELLVAAWFRADQLPEDVGPYVEQMVKLVR
jgi:8-oxo-dGTP pyrophosphatase MutT (NUDIX family)